jgi:hypothetical protein
MASDRDLLSILRLTKSIENGYTPVGFREDDRGSRSLSKLESLASNIQSTNVHRKNKISKRRKNNQRTNNQQPFTLAWGSLPLPAPLQSNKNDGSALSFMESPVRRSSLSRSSTRSKRSISSSTSNQLDTLLPGAQKVIENAAESGRVGLYDRLNRKRKDSPKNRRKKQKNGSPHQFNHNPERLLQPPSPQQPSSPLPQTSSSSSQPTTTRTTRTSTPTNTNRLLPLLINPPTNLSPVLHMPPMHFSPTSCSIVEEDSNYNNQSNFRRMYHHDFDGKDNDRRVLQLQRHADIASVLHTAVEHARQEVRSTKEMQKVTIDKYSKLLPEAFIIHYPSLRSETHVRAMQKIVDYVWAYYLRAFMRPTWKKWVDMVTTYVADMKWAKSIVIQKYTRGRFGRKKYNIRNELFQENKKMYRHHINNMIQHRIASCIKIQTFIRQSMTKLYVERHYIEPKKAVLCISRFWRALAASRMVQEMKRNREKKNMASSIIQRCWTGYRGRCQFWNELRIYRVKTRENHLMDPKWVMRHDFERRGAMLRIQRWWKSHLARKYFTKRLVKKLKIIMATHIQSFYRSYKYGTVVSKNKLNNIMKNLDNHYVQNLKTKNKLHKKQEKERKRKGLNKNEMIPMNEVMVGIHNWITCGHNNKVVQWTSEYIINNIVQKSTLMYLKHMNERNNKILQNRVDNGETMVSSSEEEIQKLLIDQSIHTKIELKKWRRRADQSIQLKHIKLNELKHSYDKRLLIFPFDIITLRLNGQRNINDKNNMKLGLRYLIRSLWSSMRE